jgi:hypothetical protein
LRFCKRLGLHISLNHEDSQATYTEPTVSDLQFAVSHFKSHGIVDSVKARTFSLPKRLPYDGRGNCRTSQLQLTMSAPPTSPTKLILPIRFSGDCRDQILWALCVVLDCFLTPLHGCCFAIHWRFVAAFAVYNLGLLAHG